MPLFITQGRFTQDAMRGMLARPEDRAESVGKLFAALGGKLLAYYATFGDYDFLVISEGPVDGVISSSLVAGAAGGVTDLHTTLAIGSGELRDACARAAGVAAQFRAAGTAT